MTTYLIGKITNTHGVKGEVLIKPLTDFDRFIKNKEIYTLNPNKTLTIKSVRHHNKGLIVSFYDLDDINLVKPLKGFELYSDERPILDEGEYHMQTLIGLEVKNQHNVLRGVVVDVIEVPQGHLLRVDIGRETKLIPFNNTFIKSVTDHIVVEEIEGLLWLSMC